jgi:hypothetical protein
MSATETKKMHHIEHNKKIYASQVYLQMDSAAFYYYFAPLILFQEDSLDRERSSVSHKVDEDYFCRYF